MSDREQILADVNRMAAEAPQPQGPDYLAIHKAVAKSHRVSVDHVKDVVRDDLLMQGAG